MLLGTRLASPPVTCGQCLPVQFLLLLFQQLLQLLVFLPSLLQSRHQATGESQPETPTEVPSGTHQWLCTISTHACRPSSAAQCALQLPVVVDILTSCIAAILLRRPTALRFSTSTRSTCREHSAAVQGVCGDVTDTTQLAAAVCCGSWTGLQTGQDCGMVQGHMQGLCLYLYTQLGSK